MNRQQLIDAMGAGMAAQDRLAPMLGQLSRHRLVRQEGLQVTLHLGAVEVDDVETTRMLKNLFQQHDVMCHLVYAGGIEAQRLWAGADQSSAGDRVAAGKERHVMPLLHQLFRQIRDYTLGPAVIFRGTLSNSGATCAILIILHPSMYVGERGGFGLARPRRIDFVQASVGCVQAPDRRLDTLSACAKERRVTSIGHNMAAGEKPVVSSERRQHRMRRRQHQVGAQEPT